MLIKALGNNILAFLKKHFLPYLVKQAPVEENGVTLVLDEGVDRQADRPYLYKRCLKTNQGGTDEITLTEAAISTGYTLLFWAKFNSVSHNHYIVQKRNPSIAPSEGYYMYSPAGGNVYFGFQAGGSIVNLGSDWRVLDEWHLYGITFSGTGLRDVTVFRDGVQIATGNTGADYVPCTNGQNLRLAFDSYGIADCYWKNVKQFLGDALTAEEQLAIYENADVQITPTTEYLFEEGDGTIVYATDGTEGTITTSNINAVRVEQEDAPLLPNSGDIVGCNVYDEAVLPIGVTEGSYTNLVTYTGRKDFPLTPKDEPAYKNAGTDYATLSSDIIINDSDVIELETLVTNYPAQGDHCITGWSTNNNNFIGLSGASSMVIKNGGNIVIQSTGLDLSSINQYTLKYKFTRVSSSSTTNVEFYVYDLDGTELFSYTGGSMSGALSTLNLLYKGENSSKYFVGTIAWTKFTRNGTLEHWWEYLGKNSLIIWDRTANKNHATITTNNITLNQGTQDVYSSRLKDGYSDGSGAYLGEFIPANSYIEKLTETPNSDVLFKGGSNLNFGTTQTINIWYKLTPNSQNQSYLLYEGPNRYTLFISANTLYFQPHQDGGSGVINLGSLVTGHAWFDDTLQMLTITRDNNSVAVYLNGLFKGSLTGSLNNVNTEVTGIGGGSTANRNLVGIVPNVAVWSDVKDSSFISALYSNGALSDESSTSNILFQCLYTNEYVDTLGVETITTSNTSYIESPITPVYDIFGNTLTNPAGTYLHSDIKLTSPVFRTLDTALQSNEELYRDTTDANGNAVKDRLLIPVSYGKSDKGFPAFDTNNGDYAMFTPIDVRSGYGNVGGQTNRFEALIIDYNSSRMIMGNSLSANRAFGFQFGDVIAWHNGSSIYQVDCGLGLASRTEPFIAIWEWTVESVSSAPQVTNIYLAIQDLQGNILFESNGLPSNNTANAFTYLDTIGNKGGTLGDPIDATIAYIKYYKNDVLTHWWQYTGNNSFLVQEVVGDNHGTITTSNIANNQGEQNVFNALVDGFSLGVDATYPTVKLLPQYPYNGLDIFDNTLTTPRSKERTKSLKYTDND